MTLEHVNNNFSVGKQKVNSKVQFRIVALLTQA